MILDVNLTVEFLLQSGYLEEFFTTIFETWRHFRLSYERKLFALAISNLIFNGSNIPPFIQNKIGFYLAELVNLLMRQQRLE